MVKFKLKIPIYNIKILFYISDDFSEMINLIKEKHDKDKLYKLPKKEINKLCGVVIGEFIPKNNLIYVLIKRENGKINMNTLTHEIYHLTTKIMKLNNFNLYETDEPFAMLNGCLNSNVINELLQIGETFYYHKNKEIKIKTI